MEECIGKICSKIIALVFSRVRNVCCLEDNFRSMQKSWGELNAVKEEMKRAQKIRKPSENSSKWMEAVENTGKEVEDITKQYNENKSKMIVGFCCRWSISCRVLECQNNIKERRDEHESVCRSEGPESPFQAIKYIRLESFKKKKSEIKKLLSHNMVPKIGVWGEKGAGKTTLLTLIRNSKRLRQIFDHNIFLVDLSPSAEDMISIQDTIRKNLGLPSKSSPAELKDSIYSHLLGRKFLLILDNFQGGGNDLERLNEERVGLPLCRQNYKIVFSCEEKDLCEKIGGTQIFKMGKLSVEEQVTLFKGLIYPYQVKEEDIEGFFKGEWLPSDIVENKNTILEQLDNVKMSIKTEKSLLRGRQRDDTVER